LYIATVIELTYIPVFTICCKWLSLPLRWNSN